MVNVVDPPITSSESRIVRTRGSFLSRCANGGEVKCASIADDPASKAITASGWVIVTVNRSKRVGWLYFCLAYIFMTIEGIETLIAVTAILSLAVMSSSFFRWSARVLRYIGIDDMAATPLTFTEAAVRSQSVMNAGGPAVMKSAEPERRASFITEGPPMLIQRTFRFGMPASFARFSMS